MPGWGGEGPPHLQGSGRLGSEGNTALTTLPLLPPSRPPLATPAPGALGRSPPPRLAGAGSGAGRRPTRSPLPRSLPPLGRIRSRHLAQCSRPCEGGSWPQPPRLLTQASTPRVRCLLQEAFPDPTALWLPATMPAGGPSTPPNAPCRCQGNPGVMGGLSGLALNRTLSPPPRHQVLTWKMEGLALGREPRGPPRKHPKGSLHEKGCLQGHPWGGKPQGPAG